MNFAPTIPVMVKNKDNDQKNYLVGRRKMCNLFLLTLQILLTLSKIALEMKELVEYYM